MLTDVEEKPKSCFGTICDFFFKRSPPSILARNVLRTYRRLFVPHFLVFWGLRLRKVALSVTPDLFFRSCETAESFFNTREND